MKFRVIIEVGVFEAYVDFDEIVEACDFAKTLLTHKADSEDTKKKTVVRIEATLDDESKDGEDL